MIIKLKDKEIHISKWLVFSILTTISGIAEMVARVAEAKNKR